MYNTMLSASKSSNKKTHRSVVINHVFIRIYTIIFFALLNLSSGFFLKHFLEI